MALTPLVIFGLPAALLFMLGGKKSAPQQPGQGWSPPAPGVAPGSPVELRRAADGKTYVYFVQSVAADVLKSLSQCYLVPNIQKPQPELSFYDVVPIAQYGAVPGLGNAATIVQQAVANGMIVEGSATLPYPASNAGRQVAIGDLSARRLCDPQYQMPYAILGDPEPSTPLGPGYQQGSTAPAVPGQQPYTPGTNVPNLPPGGGSLPPVTPPEWDANIPASVRARVEAMLSDPAIDPAALDAAATDLAPSYPLAAAKLRARAAELRLGQKLDDQKRGGTPFTIRSGDTGSFLANYYTGSANRWREIPAANPGMRAVTTNGVTQLVPWQGTILLPLAWDCRSKPLPPLQSGGPRTPATPGAPSAQEIEQAAAKAVQQAVDKAKEIFV